MNAERLRELFRASANAASLDAATGVADWEVAERMMDTPAAARIVADHERLPQQVLDLIYRELYPRYTTNPAAARSAAQQVLAQLRHKL